MEFFVVVVVVRPSCRMRSIYIYMANDSGYSVDMICRVCVNAINVVYADVDVYI